MAKKATSQTNQQRSTSKFDWDKRERIIWKLKQLKNEDWNFEPHKHELRDKEGRIAFDYELARNISHRVEMARKLSCMDLNSRHEAEHWSHRFPAWMSEDDLKLNPLKGFPPGLWFEPEFPDTPWFLIPHNRRKETIESAPEVTWGDPLRSVSLAKTISIYSQAPSVAWDADEGPGTYRCVFVIDRTFSDSQIKEALQKNWLNHHPEEKVERRNRPERQHWLPLLKALGMLRILDIYQNNRVKAEVFLQNEFSQKPDWGFDTSSPAWSKAKILVNKYLNEYQV